MNMIKTLAKDWLPPALSRQLHKLRGGGIRFEGPFTTWEAAAARCSGYDAELILDKVLAATLKVKRGEAAYERDSVLFDTIDYAWPVTAGLMWAAARNGGRLNVLDFGGALGSSYFQNRAFLDTLPEVRWSVVEQAHYVTAGVAQIQDERLKFYESIERCLQYNRPNVVLLSSVLQYLTCPEVVIQKVNTMGVSCLILDRMIVNAFDDDVIYVQHVPESIYSASYPCRSFSENRLIEAFSREYHLITSFESLPFPGLKSINSVFNGYLFRGFQNEASI